MIAKTSAGDIVVLSGSLPRGASADTYGRWTRALRDAGLKVYLDADGAALSAGLEQKPYFTKPNDHELSAMLGRELADVDAIAAAASEIVAGGIDTVCVSMGGNGAVYATADEVWYAGPVKVQVGSTVGAGDSVVAAARLCSMHRASSDRRRAATGHGHGRRKRHGERNSVGGALGCGFAYRKSAAHAPALTFGVRARSGFSPGAQ